MSKRTLPEDHCKDLQRSGGNPDQSREVRSANSATEPETIAKLLLADWGGKWCTPLTPGELLEIGRLAFEPLFQTPPLGPIPDYFRPHLSVSGCVVEYEEKIEELERWKANQLGGWLQEKIGNEYRVGEKTYQLHGQGGKGAEPARYWFELIVD
ncbi:MAG: hypothetical protein JSU72_06070 [Deltaproteobacteria bacterium]|nr:MAG: hypothetical protein JSU72_06070 [Deltaproteobacteria bacterium]